MCSFLKQAFEKSAHFFNVLVLKIIHNFDLVQIVSGELQTFVLTLSADLVDKKVMLWKTSFNVITIVVNVVNFLFADMDKRVPTPGDIKPQDKGTHLFLHNYK